MLSANAIQAALESELVIDITTTGKNSGEQRRIEIWFHNVDGTIYITGSPGPRGWYANLLADPDFTFHLKQSVNADIPATATPITDPDERREVFKKILAQGRWSKRDGIDRLDEWVAHSPLVSVELELPAG